MAGFVFVNRASQFGFFDFGLTVETTTAFFSLLYCKGSARERVIKSSETRAYSFSPLVCIDVHF